jgi:hypothetical protein
MGRSQKEEATAGQSGPWPKQKQTDVIQQQVEVERIKTLKG